MSVNTVELVKARDELLEARALLAGISYNGFAEDANRKLRFVARVLKRLVEEDEGVVCGEEKEA